MIILYVDAHVVPDWPLGAPSSCLPRFSNQDLGAKCAHSYLAVTALRPPSEQSWGRCAETETEMEAESEMHIEI